MARMRTPIHSVKHFTQRTLATVTIGAINEFTIATAVVAPDANNANEVTEGSEVRAVYVEMWYTGDDAVQSSVLATIEKRPSGLTAMTFAQGQSLFTYPNKKNILYTTMGLVPPNTQSGVPLIRQWIKIPKGKQRFGLGDTLVLNSSGISDGANICGFMLYKEYR